MRQIQLKTIVRTLIGLLTLSIMVLIVWTIQLNSDIQARLQNGWFLPPIEIYSTPPKVSVGAVMSEDQFTALADSMLMRKRKETQKILDGDWARLTRSVCENYFSEPPKDEFDACLVFDIPDETNRTFPGTILLLDSETKITSMYSLADGYPIQAVELKPYLFAQYYGGKPILRRIIEVSETPLQCLQAVTAIEDPKFLEHTGVSITGTLRAIYKNLVAGRYAEGGSTITQQLVKNYFLTAEKTIKRKITEQLMAVLLEINTDKDTILQNYLNVNYMGANGPFQVVGFGAASQHYFQKPLENLNLAECALLAAIVNSPGRYNPFRNPENAIKRRTRVLTKMLDHEMIDEKQKQKAETFPLPKKKSPVLSEPAPYYVQAVLRKVKELEIENKNGIKVYTSLDLRAQEAAQTTVLEKTRGLESWFKHLKVLKEKEGKSLQSSLISVDVKSGGVVALVGGRSFSKTQYNRILDSKRQVGSTMKPFVYLAALESLRSDGSTYNAVTPLMDAVFTHEYDGQEWSPKNYGDKYFGQVPMYFALKNSLNTATARLGLEIGLESIIDVARRFGIEANLKPLPSITLGAFEIRPWELATAYTAVARLGERVDLSLIEEIWTGDGTKLFKRKLNPQPVSSPEATAALVAMMKQTLQTGTAKASKQMGFNGIAAGKTGTTSDSKDAWFVGFTPELLTIVWVGYDDNTSHGLTGASAALPIWTHYMNQALRHYSNQDFSWPEGTFPTQVGSDQLAEVFTEFKDYDAPVELLFRSQDQAFDD